MITRTHIQQLEDIEGDFLFIVDTDIDPADGAFRSSLGRTKIKSL